MRRWVWPWRSSPMWFSRSLLLMLAAFPLISMGTTGGRPVLWWMGLALLVVGALIPPAMRYMPEERVETHESATDLGDSCRVC